ncbi:MAG: xanthine dehydrogenase family protein subunit M [Deltaproteobacteria bacterium]|nr:xanthine dehydrogenase family protein subunit M [Deltaproteobacteria bacterium]
MTSLPHFVHHQPTTLDEALALVDRYGTKGRLLAGGTEVIPKLRSRALCPDQLISVNRITELSKLEVQSDGELVIGAGARVSEVGRHETVREVYPALAHACSVMATTQIRNMATVAGNLVNGSPCADTACPLLVYDARLVLASRSGRREIPISAFYQGPGQVDISPKEIVVEIVVPPVAARTGSAYQRISARSSVDMAAASVAALVTLDGKGQCSTVRVAMGAVAPTPLRCKQAEALLADQAPDAEHLAWSSAAVAKAAAPIDDVRATAAYRRAVLPVLARRVLEQSLTRAGGGAQ